MSVPVVNFRAFRYRVRTRPVPVGRETLLFRDGILLQSVAEPLVWSEASPLPGLSTETLDDVIHAIRVGAVHEYPSLEFAVEALTSSAPIRGSVRLNALITDKDNDIATNLDDCVRSNFRAVKLKVGRQNLDADIRRVRAVRESLSFDQQLRLDANRAWSLGDAIAFARAVDDLDIEYVEEPLSNPGNLEILFAETGLRYALDETLVERASSLDAFPNAAALVVKPTCVGGERRIAELFRSGKPIVLSAAFESGVGLFQIARLAAHFMPEVPIGLDTYRWLLDDVLVSRWNMDDGVFRFNDRPIVNRDRLEEISL